MKKLWLLVGVVCLGLLMCISPDTGTIEITSNPSGAYVYLDGDYTGKETDCVLRDVPFGDHTLTLVLSGYPSWKRYITLSEDQPDLDINADFTIIPAQVTGLTAEATTNGAGFKLTWEPAENAETYKVYFRPYDYYYDEELLADGLTTTEYTHANPEYTGRYRVSGDAGGMEGPKSEALSTESTPVRYLEVCELNGPGYSGISWDVLTGFPASYLMADETYQDRIDCYFTNLATGYTDTPYYLAGADVVAEDEGNTWLDPDGWRAARVSDPVDFHIYEGGLAPAGSYKKYTEVEEYETYAVLTEDGYYALMYVEYIDPGRGEVDISTTFQPIKGSRLFSGEYY
ncbi:hypothetical protein ES703_32035 [subsurface metagenome]|nr:PEGA domain-containing protein [bacterium]